MGLALLGLLFITGTEPADADLAFEPRRPPDPPVPDPTRGQGAGGSLLLPVPRKGRECPHPDFGGVYGLDVLACSAGHRRVKTRRVVLDYRGQPVRRRK